VVLQTTTEITLQGTQTQSRFGLSGMRHICCGGGSGGLSATRSVTGAYGAQSLSAEGWQWQTPVLQTSHCPICQLHSQQ
jgi:hypothetical protein